MSNKNYQSVSGVIQPVVSAVVTSDFKFLGKGNGKVEYISDDS